jgi:hypothetical protein
MDMYASVFSTLTPANKKQVVDNVFFSAHRTPPSGAQSRQSRDKSGREKNNTCCAIFIST